MAAIKVTNKNDIETLKLQTSLGLVNEIYSRNNKWLISRMEGTCAMKWKAPTKELKDEL